MLVIQDLAEHMLIALATRISGAISGEVEDSDVNDGGELSWMWTMDCWSSSDQDSIKSNVITLMEASGQLIDKGSNKRAVPKLPQA